MLHYNDKKNIKVVYMIYLQNILAYILIIQVTYISLAL